MSNRAQDFQNQTYQTKKNGEVTIDYEPTSNTKKQFSKDSGEYVDFEEIKD